MEAGMQRRQLAKWTGGAFILGAVTFITILNGSDGITIPGSVLSTVLLGAGLAGLRACYGDSAGGLARHIVPMVVMGTVLLCLPIAVLALIPHADIAGSMEDGIWVLLFEGPAVALLGLTLFGLAILRTKPMPRLNWLPVVAGVWYPLFYFYFAGYLFTHHGRYSFQYYPIFQFISLIQFVALCALGATLIAEARPASAGSQDAAMSRPT
jgi:hypothetical protein